MARTQEATVRDLLALLESGELSTRIEEATGYFTGDVTYVMRVPGEPVKGGEALAQELIRQTGHYTDLRIDIRSLVSAGRYVFTERVDSFVLPHTGNRVSNELVAVFEFDDAGLITDWREYWDAASLAAAMGITPAAG